MTPKKENKWLDSLFFKWVLNNQAVVALIITFLIFLTLYLFTQISFLFSPFISFIGVVMLPLVISAILYYLIKPLVVLLENYGLGRKTAIFTVFALIILLLIALISSVVPMVQEQLTSFMENLPSYVRSVDTEATKLLQSPWLDNYQEQLEELLTTISARAMDYAEDISRNTLTWVSDFAGAIARITIAIIISPFILFYLLRDSDKMKEGLLSVVPTTLRTPVSRVLRDINNQLSGYVKGQVTVATVVGVIFSILFSLIGLRYAVTFGIIAGLLNMIPYLGSFLAMVPVVVIGLVQGPFMLVKVLVVFVIEQTIEGRFVSPLVLGSKLNIHPITIMFILLTAGAMFGVWGVFLGIPLYASLKVVIRELFTWYKQVSGLYDEEVIEEDGQHVK